MKELFEKMKEKLIEMKIVRVEQCHEDYELEVMTERDFDDAIEIVNQVAEECKDKYVSIGVYKQVAWERDVAIEQLHELGYEFGQKIDVPDINVGSNDGWILCSEKTPEFEIYTLKRMWVTMHRKGSNFCFTRKLRWNGYQGRWEWENGKTISNKYEIIAWKPLEIPAPYKPNGE